MTNRHLADGLEWVDPKTAAHSTRFYRATPAEFAHPEALASTQWLEEHLADASLRIVDARYPQSLAAFKTGHIPGAVMVEPLADLSDPTQPGLAMVPTVKQFERLMQRLGVSNDSIVVVYDTEGGPWCARLWWALRYYGHNEVKLLDGGFKKWQLESRPVQKEITSPPAASFKAEVRPELRVLMADVQKAIGQTNVLIIDARPTSYYIDGHIPSAKCVPAPSNLDPRTCALLRPVQRLVSLYQRAGLQPGKRVITSCGGGYYGALDLFVLFQLGYENVSLYDGSWMEWSTRGGAVEKGP